MHEHIGMNGDPRRDLLRHALATIAYRGKKTMTGAPAGFAEFSAGAGTRTPAQVVAHIGDLFDWALSLVKGAEVWHDSKALPWDEEIARFHRTLMALDAAIAAAPDHLPIERLFQGPVADALTHVGQLAMLRRMAGSPIKGENFFKAGIETGKGLGLGA